jgi:hypothetical protein
MPHRENHTEYADNLNEIAELLAAGLLRLRTRQSTPDSPHLGESALDCGWVQSGPADDLKSEGDPR